MKFQIKDHPTEAKHGAAMGAFVVELDNPEGTDAVTVALACSPCCGYNLKGTLTKQAVKGKATFDDLQIDYNKDNDKKRKPGEVVGDAVVPGPGPDNQDGDNRFNDSRIQDRYSHFDGSCRLQASTSNAACASEPFYFKKA